MLSHTTAREWLIPYADGMLSADERERIDGHVTGCAACGREVDVLRQLNLALVSLPPAPPLAFAPFWLKLQATLPAPRSAKAAAPRYRRVGIAFAAAAFAVLAVATSALAAESALPDSALYPIKQVEESLQLSLAPAPQRLEVEIRIGSERLREAQVMVAAGKPTLAAKSVRAFRLLIPSIAAGLGTGVDAKRAHDARATLDVELAAVQEANATRGDDDAEVKQLVLTSLRDLDDTQPADPAVTVVPAVSATPATVQPTAKPTVRPTSRPERKRTDD
ncbi:MAG: DUF5667 domain-containing protein [Candidatus Dormibacter sp.]